MRRYVLIISSFVVLFISGLFGDKTAFANTTYIAEPDFLSGWTLSTTLPTGTDSRLLLGNQLASGIIPGGTNPDHWSSTATMTATMPSTTDEVRWSFWAQMLTAGMGPGWLWKPEWAGFSASIQGVSNSVELRIWAKQDESVVGPVFDWDGDNWDVQPYNLFPDSWEITSDDLNNYFAPGEVLTFTLIDTVENNSLGPSGSMNHPLTRVLSEAPGEGAYMPGMDWWFIPPGGGDVLIPQATQVVIIPVPGAFLLGGIGVSLIGWLRTRKVL